MRVAVLISNNFSLQPKEYLYYQNQWLANDESHFLVSQKRIIMNNIDYD